MIAAAARTVLSLACLLLPACAGGAAAGPAPGPEPALRGGWELVELSSGDIPAPLPASGRATLVVEEATVSGTAFCNGYGGDYRLAGGRLLVQDLAVTEMACAPELMAAERAYLDALTAADLAVARDGDRLVLTGDGGALTFRPLPPVPTSELVGTRWVLETLIDGDVASSTTGEPADLVLGADGTVSGSTGCRALTGRWAVSGDTLVLPDLGADGNCPPGVATQDAHVLAVLESPRPEIEGDRLLLSGPGRLGLGYRAASG